MPKRLAAESLQDLFRYFEVLCSFSSQGFAAKLLWWWVGVVLCLYSCKNDLMYFSVINI